ncbi:hypothetical protein R1sor_009235 [Riccia sorocarpa]|uniref:Uncharacterized protein n=1 Tax=Riccia sorocarpa TaxID=122646 RepID=A0ABD3H728_9MARC
MAEHSESTDPNEAIHQVIEEIPLSSPIASGKEAETTEGTSTSDDPVAAEITPKSPAAVAVNSTPAIQKPVRGSQLKKVTTPAVAAPSPPTTRSAAGKKRQKQKMATISAPKDDGGRESGAFSTIIHTYTMKFENHKPTPKILLCRLVQFTRVRQFQTTSLQTEALKKSFETHCYMEHFAAFHVSMFDENDNKMLVTDEDKAGWDMLWRMESQDFDAECSKIPEYQHLVNKKFSTWDGNHRLITWMQVLSTPLSEYKEMIGSDVYEEFERARQKSSAKTAWTHENKTSSAAAYILSFGEVSAAKDAQLVAEEEAKKQGKPISSKQKKDMWDARVKEVCASWSSQVFKYATVVNPSLGQDFLAAVRELHNSLARVEKSKREVAHSVGLDRVKAFASAGIHNSLKIELLKVHYNDEKTREKYHHPTKFDVDNDLHPWLAQWATLVIVGTLILEGTCLLPSLEKRIPHVLNEEDPFNVSHDRFESGEEDEVLTQAEFVEPSKNIDGLVLDTSRTKKQKEARQSSKAEEEKETGGSTPTGKAKEQPKPGSGRTRSAKKQTKDKAPKQLKKKRDEPAEAEPVLETPALEIEPNVTEAGTSTHVVEEQAPDNDKSTQKEEARQRKRTKKQANTVLYEGVFREDIYFPMKNRCVTVKSSLKETHELLHSKQDKGNQRPCSYSGRIEENVRCT